MIALDIKIADYWLKQGTRIKRNLIRWESYKGKTCNSGKLAAKILTTKNELRAVVDELEAMALKLEKHV